MSGRLAIIVAAWSALAGAAVAQTSGVQRTADSPGAKVVPSRSEEPIPFRVTTSHALPALEIQAAPPTAPNTLCWDDVLLGSIGRSSPERLGFVAPGWIERADGMGAPRDVIIWAGDDASAAAPTRVCAPKSFRLKNWTVQLFDGPLSQRQQFEVRQRENKILRFGGGSSYGMLGGIKNNIGSDLGELRLLGRSVADYTPLTVRSVPTGAALLIDGVDRQFRTDKPIRMTRRAFERAQLRWGSRSVELRRCPRQPDKDGVGFVISCAFTPSAAQSDPLQPR